MSLVLSGSRSFYASGFKSSPLDSWERIIKDILFIQWYEVTSTGGDPLDITFKFIPVWHVNLICPGKSSVPFTMVYNLIAPSAISISTV
jgi:hypothetical protein